MYAHIKLHSLLLKCTTRQHRSTVVSTVREGAPGLKSTATFGLSVWSLHSLPCMVASGLALVQHIYTRHKALYNVSHSPIHTHIHISFFYIQGLSI